MARPARPDLQVVAWLFLFVGAFVGVLWAVYLLTDDDAGQMLLAVTSLFGLYVGGFFWLRRRGLRGRGSGPHRPPTNEAHYLPHASVWPFVLGVAAFLLSNGLILGTWFLVPGGLLLLAGVVGLGHQSRLRH